jgi:predicted AAA+ superfamily ATPase
MLNYYKRAVLAEFHKKVLPNKVLILLGARRVGKTDLIKNYLKSIPTETYLQLNGEDKNNVNLLKERSVSNYKRLLANVNLLVIDEAQNIPDIVMVLKLIVDSI